MYSIAGANIPNGAVDALIMDSCFSSGSMISLLLVRQPTGESDRLGAHEWRACPQSQSSQSRPACFDLQQVPGGSSVYRHTAAARCLK